MNQRLFCNERLAIYRALLLLFFLTQAHACSNEADKQRETKLSLQAPSPTAQDNWSSVKLPDLSQQPITLRVVNVVNPRFKQLTQAQIEKILARSRVMVKQYFAIDIDFAEVTTLEISELFNRIKPNILEQRNAEIVDIRFISEQDRVAMQGSIFKTLTNYSDDEQKVIDYAQPFLLHPQIRQTDFLGLSHALLATLISRLQYWQHQTAADGKPVIDNAGYNEWVWWDCLGYGELPFEIVITNQLVASAEYYGMDVHSSLRGGVSAGTTTYSRDGLLSTYLYIMVYPMLNDTDLLTMLRQDKTYSEAQIIDYAAALLTHELGHMLLHLGHPFGDNGCIMSPTTMLNYREWYNALDSRQCPPGSSQQMMPGAATIEYNRSW